MAITSVISNRRVASFGSKQMMKKNLFKFNLMKYLSKDMQFYSEEKRTKNFIGVNLQACIKVQIKLYSTVSSLAS